MTLFHPRGKKTVISLMGLCFTVVLSSITVFAGEPEYMRLDFENIQAVEVQGGWDSDAGVFVATDIEELPQPRRPKLRGILEEVNLEKKSIKMYGIDIEIDYRTQFLDEGDGPIVLKDLKKGQWLEVSCNIDSDDGEWEARKISFKNIKKSNKIKGNLTGKSIDGAPPDTIEIHGLKILLNRETDVNYPGSSFEDIELYLFGDLALPNPVSYDQGILVGDKMVIGGEYRQNVENERDYDLSENISSNQKNVRPEIRIELSRFFSDHFRAFAQARVRELVYLDSERINPPGQNLNSEITQFYILARNIGLKGLALQLGRQDVDEPREWLYDDYLDAVRVFYYGIPPLVFEAAYIHSDFQLKRKFRTWTDLFFQARYRIDRKSSVRAYFLSRGDTDSTRSREPVYIGFGYNGRIRQSFRPWAEISILRGEDKGKKLRAMAYDIGATAIAFGIRYVPSVTIGYARGSGDKSAADAVSNEFRQTGYQDNVGYFGGVRTLHLYGELLDPELSNIKIMTAGIGFHPTTNSSLEIIYHTYKQDQLDSKKVRGSLLYPPPIPNGVSAALGWGLDFALGLANLWNRASFVWTYAIFKPGDAYPSYDNTPNSIAASNKINLKIDL